ncbi:hypothetical protein ILUMI_24545 [Ignelater luminosus]|uniref:Mutator-like transposase domain-containing protein n=1 Tax=Ignelater luminosus TaxID=2038154 RepID=A0A8K0C6W6_IGNLU|nr:hypothetical protein ILUMI_24545 [Ignelater luminosus]
MGNYTRKEKETNRRTRTLSGKRKSRRNAALKVQERKKKCTRPTSSHSHVDKNEQPNSFGKAESIVANGTASPGCNRIQTTPDRQILNDSVENTTETVLITGRRLFDVGYLFKQLLASEKHAPFDCDITNMYVVKELRKGLQSSFELKCKMCGITTTLLTENPEEEGILNINLAVTLACVSTGVGQILSRSVIAELTVDGDILIFPLDNKILPGNDVIMFFRLFPRSNYLRRCRDKSTNAEDPNNAPNIPNEEILSSDDDKTENTKKTIK